MSRYSLLLLCFCFVTIRSWVVTDLSIPSSTRTLSSSFPVNITASFFTIVHCAGAFNFYFDYNTPATTSSDLIPWVADNRYDSFNLRASSGTCFTLAQCLDTTTNSVCANFTLVQHNTIDELPQFFVQTPNGTNAVRGELTNSGKSGKLTWDVVNPANPVETYELYWANTQTAPEGQSFATACSVKSWMSLFTSAQGSYSNNGDGTWSATVNNLDPKTPFTVVVVANRENSISGAYNSFTLNGKSAASSLIPSFLLLAVAIGAFMW